MDIKVRLDVGEPRGFDGGDGTPVIIGTVDERLSGSRQVENQSAIKVVTQGLGSSNPVEHDTLTEYWFVINFSPITYGETTFTSLLLTPRYKAKKPPVDSLKAGDELVVNGIWRKDGQPWDEQSIESAKEGELEIEGMVVAKTVMLDDTDD